MSKYRLLSLSKVNGVLRVLTLRREWWAGGDEVRRSTLRWTLSKHLKFWVVGVVGVELVCRERWRSKITWFMGFVVCGVSLSKVDEPRIPVGGSCIRDSP